MPVHDLDGDKGILTLRFSKQTSITGYHLVTPNVTLLASGMLFIREGYVWDYGTWAIDTPAVIVASLVHDALCDLIAQGELPLQARKDADLFYRKMLKEGGMSWFRRQVQYFSIRGYVLGFKSPMRFLRGFLDRG